MAYDVTASFQSEAVKIEGSHPVDMYVVNASYSGADYLYFVDAPQDIYGFMLNASGNVTATEQLYTGLPITRGALDTNVQGEVGGVSITIPNTDRAMESVIQNYDYLRGCDVHVISTFATYLPSGSSTYYIGTAADHNAIMKEKLFIDSSTSDENVVTFSCKPKFTIKSVPIPRRKFVLTCWWAQDGNYGGTECGANATVVASWTTCDGTLSSCKERRNQHRFGGFPSIPRKGITII